MSPRTHQRHIHTAPARALPTQLWALWTAIAQFAARLAGYKEDAAPVKGGD